MQLKAKDVAEILGVSAATISLVLNNKPGVSEQKRQEIIEKIKELGCDYLLRDVSVNKGNVGFVVYKVTGKIIDESPFYSYILEGLNKTLSKNGYTLSLLYIDHSTPVEEQIIQLQSQNCRGLIIFGVEMERSDLQVFIDSGLPFVVLDNSFQDSDVDSVAINNAQGMRKCMQYLYSMGHRKIGYIRCRDRITSFEERYQSYLFWMNTFGLPVKQEDIWDVEYSDKEIRQEIKEYLGKMTEIPTAFFAENDFIACSAMKGMQEAGYQIPDDISVIGFDDRPVCQMIQPSVTTINVPKDAFGSSAAELLMSKINEQRGYSYKLEIGTRLVERASVKSIEH